MTIDFLDFLRKARGDFAFVATYEFDPQFFERRILSSRSFEGAKVAVFLDRHRYSEILASGRQGEAFDRDYFVIPIDRGGGVFHPKLYLSIGKKSSLVSVGSNNCTASGTGHNYELISGCEAPADGSNSIATELVGSVFREFRRYAEDTPLLKGSLERSIFAEAKAAHPWLAAPPSSVAPKGVEFLSSHEKPLLPQALNRLPTTVISEITLMAPFFGKDLSLIDRLRSIWPDAAFRILTQSGYSNLRVQEVERLQADGAKISLFTVNSRKSGRNLHAKSLAFTSAEGTYWLSGSANMSNSAMYGTSTETCLWFKTLQTVDQALENDELSWQSIAPSKFEMVPIEEPLPPADEPHQLKLQSLVLKEDGDLIVAGTSPEQASGLRLQVTKRRDNLPALSKPITFKSGQCSVSLSQNERAIFDKAALGQLVATVDGKEVSSNHCSIAQLGRLMRERSGGGSTGNRVARIRESGDGLIEYIDTLEGIDAAIDFMNNTTIRFHDGAAGTGGGGTVWRPRDPFSGDIPDEWMLGSSGGTATELRDAVCAFVERHVNTRLERHAKKGNLAGLENFMDIFCASSRILLTWHHRLIEGQPVVPCPYLTKGMQEILATLVGPLKPEDAEHTGFGAALMRNLRADRDLVRMELNRLNVAAVVTAACNEMIRARALHLGRSSADEWSSVRGQWISSWLKAMELDKPTEAQILESGAEFQKAA